MDTVVSIIQIIPNFCSQISHQTGYVRQLRENVDTLMKEAELLQCKCKDMEREGEEASRRGGMLTNQAQNWLKEARNTETEINSIKSEFDHRKTFCNGCFPDLLSHYKLGRRAIKKLKDVQGLIERGAMDRVAVTIASPTSVVKMSTPSLYRQTTSQQTMNEILGHLRDEHSSIICLYGMGGIGKTTIMKAINNKLIETREFEVVIWVTLSKDLNLERIQKEIINMLGLDFNDHDSDSKRRAQILNWLEMKRFLLILDDLWHEINLDHVGVPNPNVQNRSKIAITTRLVEVCNNMVADAKIRVNTLTEEEALDLFVDNANEVARLPLIEKIAKDVVRECDGLPLAITIVGRALRDKERKEVWENALRVLRASAPEITGMEPKVFRPLKLSYDQLEDEKVKMCFLYCSLFPEDYEICASQLIWWWIMEGFIDNVDNLIDASNKGHYILEKLKDGCLLEEGTLLNKHVKMHDVIRDLALWITSSSSNECSKFLVRAGIGLKEPPHEENWKEMEKISLMRNAIAGLPVSPNCHNLVSLFVRENPITFIPCTFFEFMPILQVLDLSATTITSLTVSSSSLLNLRALLLKGCATLRELPFLGQLKDLQFLDLSYSGISSFPQEMQNLVKLKKLNVSHLQDGFIAIPSNIISKLSSLEDLRMKNTRVNWAKEVELEVANDATLRELEKLTRLTTLKICIHDINCVAEEDAFLGRCLSLKKFKISIGQSYSRVDDLPCARQVHIYGGNNYPNGVKVMAKHAEGLTWQFADVKHGSQLMSDSESLRLLYLLFCNEMECIIDWRNAGENAMKNIEHLNLHRLPKLKKLFEGEVSQGSLRKLKKIEVKFCNKLKGLFSSKMVQNLDQLEILDVCDCDELEEIIEGDDSLPDSPLPNLLSLELYELPKLRRIISCRTVALPSLKHFFVSQCPNLRLPDCPNLANPQRDILFKLNISSHSATVASQI